MCEINEKVLNFLTTKIESTKTTGFIQFEEALLKLKDLDMPDSMKYQAALNFVSGDVTKETILGTFDKYKSVLSKEKESFLKIKVEKDKKDKVSLEKDILKTKNQVDIYSKQISKLEEQIETIKTKILVIDEVVEEKETNLSTFEQTCENNKKSFIYACDKVLENIEEEKDQMELNLN